MYTPNAEVPVKNVLKIWKAQFWKNIGMLSLEEKNDHSYKKNRVLHRRTILYSVGFMVYERFKILVYISIGAAYVPLNWVNVAKHEFVILKCIPLQDQNSEHFFTKIYRLNPFATS